MRRLSKIVATVLIFTMLITLMSSKGVCAVTKKDTSKVTYTLKKGILTIKGKGNMPKSMTFKKNKEIKKVVIKKGVTSISNYAFMGCKNLEKVKISTTVKKIGIDSFRGTGISKINIPSTVKEIGQSAFSYCKKLKTITMPGDFKLKFYPSEYKSESVMDGKNNITVKFNTQLNIKVVTYLYAYNLIPDKNDKKYKTIDGVLYTKDGKGIVRVPAARKEVVIENECEEFNIQSVIYSGVDFGSPERGCTKLKKIVIPESVKHINDTQYQGTWTRALEALDVQINTNQLDGDSINTLLIAYWKSGWEDNATENLIKVLKSITKQLPDQISVSDNMYITNDGVLLRYAGKDKKVKVSDNVKVIGAKAFADCKTIEEVELSNNTIAIRNEAFSKCDKLNEITIPENVVSIGNRAFWWCEKLKNITIPDNVKTMGEGMFSSSGIEKVSLPEGMTEIPVDMFSSCDKLVSINIPETVTIIKEDAFTECVKLDITSIMKSKNITEIQSGAFYKTKWKKIIIPSNVKKIGSYAFAHWGDDGNRSIIIKGSNKKIDKRAFGYREIKVTYKSGIQSARSNIGVTDRRKNKKGNTEVDLKWLEVSGVSGYQIKLSMDKKVKKNVKTIYVGKSNDHTTVQLETMKKRIYAKIRPYKKSNAKKIYGKWSAIDYR